MEEEGWEEGASDSCWTKSDPVPAAIAATDCLLEGIKGTFSPAHVQGTHCKHNLHHRPLLSWD